MLTFNFSPFPILHTERLLLRNITTDDVRAMYDMRSNEAVRKFLDQPKKTFEETEKLVAEIISGIEKNENILWVLSPKGTNEFIGSIGFWRMQPEHHRAEIGYGMVPKYWGSGLMTEAAKAVFKYGFEEMKLHSVEANVNPKNLPSRKLLEKCGFVQEAYFRENYYYDGKFIDSAIYSLLNPG